jgi:predicted DNA repair protein MutK
VLAWLLNAGVSAVIGLIVGFVGVALVALLSLVRRGR